MWLILRLDPEERRRENEGFEELKREISEGLRWPSQVEPEPVTDPQQDPKRRPSPAGPEPFPPRCRTDPCEHWLPISWPDELPNPEELRGGELRRTTTAEREFEGIDRAADQSKLAKKIRENRAQGLPPPSPCFEEDVVPNDPYDAHHLHPLYLGGEDAEWNLCALMADRHQDGHPRLNDQTEHLAEYMECGICSGYLSHHPVGQTYYIISSK